MGKEAVSGLAPGVRTVALPVPMTSAHPAPWIPRWPHGKWGCTFYERARRQLPISPCAATADTPKRVDRMGEDQDPFRDQWEAELAGARAGNRAASLVTTVEAGIRGWQQFSARAVVAVAEARRRAAITLSNAEGVVRQVAPVVGRGMLAISQVAAVTFAGQLNSQYRRSHHILRARGWWALSSWSDDQLARYAGLAASHSARSLDRMLCDDYSAHEGRQLRRMVQRWWDVPALKLRRPIILDAVDDHLAGRYRVSIPTLLPSLEGLVADTFGLGRRTPVTAGLESMTDILDGLDAIALDVAIGSLTYLYGPIDFPSTSPLSPRLNRHLILHGRTVRYGREGNSLKVLLHLDELHTQITTKQRLEEGRPALLQDRPIRVANELVQALGVPDEMILAMRRLEPKLSGPVGSWEGDG